MYVSVGAPGEVMPILSPRSARSRSTSGDCPVTPLRAATSVRMTRVRVTRRRMSCAMMTESSPSERSSARSSKPTSANCALPEASAAMLSLPLSTSTMLTLRPSLANSPSSLATYNADRNTLGADATVIVCCRAPPPAAAASSPPPDEPPHPATEPTSAAVASAVTAFIFPPMRATSVRPAAAEPDVRPPAQCARQRAERDAEQQDDRGQHDRPGDDPGGLVATGGRPGEVADAAVRRDEFPDDRADHGGRQRDAQRREDVRQRARQQHRPHRRQARRAHHPCDIEQARRHLPDALHCVDEHDKEDEVRGQRDLGGEPDAEPEDADRAERHRGDRVRDEEVRLHDPVGRTAQRERPGQHDAEHGADDEAEPGRGQGEPRVEPKVGRPLEPVEQPLADRLRGADEERADQRARDLIPGHQGQGDERHPARPHDCAPPPPVAPAPAPLGLDPPQPGGRAGVRTRPCAARPGGLRGRCGGRRVAGGQVTLRRPGRRAHPCTSALLQGTSHASSNLITPLTIKTSTATTTMPANMVAVSNWRDDRTIKKPSPWVAAMNSPRIAPTMAREKVSRTLASTAGAAPGNTTARTSRGPRAPSTRDTSIRPGLMPRIPAIVLTSTTRKTISAASRTFGSAPRPNHMMNMGARAILGIE